MKFYHFQSIIALAFPSLSYVNAADGIVGDNNKLHKNLRDRGLKGGVDPTRNKFVVDPAKVDGNLFGDQDVVNPLVVNGVVVDPPRKYKFFVSIGGCGASLVAPNVILSAAHCASINGPAVLGLHKHSVDGAEEFENIEIIEFADNNDITHPDYNTNTLDNDYWVIQLAHDTQLYQDYVAELDAPDDEFVLTDGQDVTVIGMGTTSSGGPSPNVLMEVTVDYIPNDQCCSDYGYSCGELTENMMCAARAGKDSCQGDSGGPIFDSATQKQVGIVSWGYGCADPRFPGVYSRVSAQYDWIKAQIDNYSSGGTNPPAPLVQGECYDSPLGYYDTRGPRYHCGRQTTCNSSAPNGGITAAEACCGCGGGEFYTGPPGPTKAPTPPPSPTPAPTCSGDAAKVEVEIVTDNYPGETSWTITNKCDGSTAASGGDYDDRGTMYSTSSCLPAANYKFEIVDSYGDGICCSYGSGSYDVKYNGQSVVSDGAGAFGSTEEVTFGTQCPPSPSPVDAEFNPALGVPKCSSAGASCRSGALLNGKENNVEPNGSNTLDSCRDGTVGSFHGDESVDSITVSAVEGDVLTAGGLAEIKAEVWAWNTGAFDTADFYYTATVNNNPTWTHIKSIRADVGGGGQTFLKVEYLLPESVEQAVRVNFRYSGDQSSCSGGFWDDVDDLVFVVAPARAGTIGGRMPKQIAEPKSIPSGQCPTIGDRNRCDESLVCGWKNGKNKGCYPIEGRRQKKPKN